MTDTSSLPPGFTLDQAPAAGLPPGFTLDQPPTGRDLGPFGALQAAARAGTGGLSDVAAAGLGSAITHLTPNPESYSDVKAQIDADAAAYSQAHPILSTAGSVAGAVAGGGALLKGVGAAAGAALPALTAKIGTALAPELSVDGQVLTGMAKLRNVARLAATGAGSGAVAGGIYGGVEGAQQGNAAGGAATGAATGAALGGVAGPVIGGVAGALAKLPDYFSDQWNHAASLLAKTFNMPATDIQKALTVQAQRTGEPVAMADIATLSNRGDLAKLAGSYKGIGNAVEARQQAMSAALPMALSGDVGRTLGAPQDLARLEELRDNNMTAAMDPIRAKPIDLNEDDIAFLTDPQITGVIGGVRAAPGEAPKSADKLGFIQQAQGDSQTLQALLTSGKASAAEVNAAGNAATKSQAIADANPLTLDDMDNFREQLRNRQSSLNSVTSTAHDRLAAQTFGDRASRVSQIASDQVPEYAQALDAYRGDQNHITGFKHGFAGARADEASGDVRKALSTPEGQQGYQAGLRSYVFDLANKGESAATATAGKLSENNVLTQNIAQTFGKPAATALQNTATARSEALTNLKAISGGPAQASEGGLQPPQIMHGALAAAHPASPWAWFHLVRATIPGLKLSNNAVQSVAQMMTDPQMAAKVPDLLRQAGAQSNQIRTLMRAAAGLAGAGAGVAAAEQ